ncbi:HET-domain-containing protein [Nemania sp. FL0916]|nr:HET-domain-containing protein [Nemania sp. FL0916]
MDLSMRLCASCSSIDLSEIVEGKLFTFDAEPLPGRDICNLCAFVRGVLSCAGEVNWLHELDAEEELKFSPMKASPMKAIQVEIIEITKTRCDVHPDSLVTVEVGIVDAWHGHTFAGNFYFRKPNGACGFPCNDTSGVHSTWARLSMALGWLQECMLKHPDCHPTESLGPSTILHRSTRFIDVRLGRLVELQEIMGTPVEFIALSYVWGNDYQLRTLAHTVREYKRGFAKDSNAASMLPKTIHDAIWVTRVLGYRFLWVDALCIIQDSPSDLEIQLAQMDRIYGLAALTIVARGSTSSNDGLSGISVPRNVLKGAYSEVTINNELSIGRWDPDCYEKYGARFDESSENRYYIWRGWTFQEQILSTRNLDFGPQRISFSCGREMEPQESGFPEYRSDVHHPNHFTHTLRQYKRTNAGDPETEESRGAMTVDMLLAGWRTVRQTYSTRSLSFPADRARAIQGTARMLRRMIGREEIDLNGHVEDRLHNELVWYVTNNPTGFNVSPLRFPPDLAPAGMFPSWSWLSVWPISFSAMLKPYPGVKLRMCSKPNSTAKDFLEIEGPTLELRVEGKSEEQTASYLDGEPFSGKLRLDIPLEPGTLVTCVPIAKSIFNGLHWEYSALLLKFERPFYTRVGIITIPKRRSSKWREYLERVKSIEDEIKVMICC